MNRFIFFFLFTFPLFTHAQKKEIPVTSKYLAELNKEVENATARFPVPNQPNLLFYLQRNKNSNTIIYEANLLADGNPDPANPVKVYWMRYNEDSSRKELNWIQRWLAYGVNFEPAKDGSGNYILSPVALKHRKITLKHDENGRPAAYMKINGRFSKIRRIYAMAEETNWLPTVKYIQLKGEDPVTKETVIEYIFPKQNKVPE